MEIVSSQGLARRVGGICAKRRGVYTLTSILSHRGRGGMSLPPLDTGSGFVGLHA